MEEVGGWIVGFLIVAAVVVWLIGMVLAAVYWVLANAAFLALAFLDGVTSSSLTSSSPAIMWAIWGGLIGGTLGFWTIAPVYGLRKVRPLIAAAPFVFMMGFAAVRVMADGGLNYSSGSPSVAAGSRPNGSYRHADIEGRNGGAVTSGTVWLRYVPEDLNWDIEYPGGWLVERTRRPSEHTTEYIRIIFQRPDSPVRAVVDMVHYQPVEDQLETFRKLSRRFERTRKGRYQEHSIERATLGGASGARWEFTLMDVQGQTMRKVDVGSNRDGTVHAVMGEAPPEEFEQWRPTFERMISSFRWK